MDNYIEFEYHSANLKGIAIELFKRLPGVSKIALTETETEEYYESSAPKLSDFDAFDALQSAIFLFGDQHSIRIHCDFDEEFNSLSFYAPKETWNTDQTQNAFAQLQTIMSQMVAA